jgi:hypothetical protein
LTTIITTLTPKVCHIKAHTVTDFEANASTSSGYEILQLASSPSGQVLDATPEAKKMGLKRRRQPFFMAASQNCITEVCAISLLISWSHYSTDGNALTNGKQPTQIEEFWKDVQPDNERLVSFFEHLVPDRKVGEGLLEGKVKRLMDPINMYVCFFHDRCY